MLSLKRPPDTISLKGEARVGVLVFLSAILLPFCQLRRGLAADVFIGISGGGEEKKMAISMPPFDSQGPSGRELARRLREVVRSDLLFSRRFEILDQQTSRYLIQAGVTDLKDQLTFQAKLMDTEQGEALVEKYYRVPTAELRKAAHLFSDEVVLKVTGRKGIAHSRIAFANDQTSHKEIYVVDYDGAGLKRLTSDSSIDLIPRWSPDGRRLVYTSYREGNPDLYEMDLDTGKSRTLSEEQGLNLAGGFSPDGNELAVTLSRGASPNIYILYPATGRLRRLTFQEGVDGSPSFSPDGAEVAFISDRAGNPELYVIEVESGRTQRLTHMNWCDSPIWSPDGEWIAFTGRAAPTEPNNIFLSDLTGSQIRQLTHGEGSNEDPGWSPDGRFLTFTSTRNGRRELFVMDADGSAPHPLPGIPGNSYTPSWSS